MDPEAANAAYYAPVGVRDSLSADEIEIIKKTEREMRIAAFAGKFPKDGRNQDSRTLRDTFQRPTLTNPTNPIPNPAPTAGDRDILHIHSREELVQSAYFVDALELLFVTNSYASS